MSLKISFDDAIKNLICIKPKIIFLTGKSGTGKSFFSSKLKQHFLPLEVDLIVRKLAKKYNIGFGPDYNEAFKVYKKKSPLFFENEFIKEIHKFINKNNNKSIIIDAAISNSELIKKIFSGKYKIFTFVFLYPNSVDRYSNRIMKRYIKDVITKKKTLPFWSEVPKEIEKASLKSKKVKTFIKDMAKKQKKKSDERYKYFLSNKFSIYTVIV
jgi:dephospho-CoA kinase